MWELIIMGMVTSLLFSTNSFGQLPVIKTTVDKNNILIGQQFNYRVDARFPVNKYKLNWFSIPDNFGNFEVVTKNTIDTSIINGEMNFSQTLVLTNFDSGSRMIPPLELSVQEINSNSSFKMFTDSISVEVAYSPLDSIQPFHDIQPMIEVESKWPWWAWALIALAVALIILWVLYLLNFFRKKKDITHLFSAKLSPMDEAMQSLSDLKKEHLTENQKEREFHTRLTDIFKRYLSRKTNSYKLHLTTDEILIELRDYNLKPDQLTAFAHCLRMGNVVKFARFIPPAYENESCFSGIKEMIAAINHSLNKTEKVDL